MTIRCCTFQLRACWSLVQKHGICIAQTRETGFVSPAKRSFDFVWYWDFLVWLDDRFFVPGWTCHLLNNHLCSWCAGKRLVCLFTPRQIVPNIIDMSASPCYLRTWSLYLGRRSRSVPWPSPCWMKWSSSWPVPTTYIRSDQGYTWSHPCAAELRKGLDTGYTKAQRFKDIIRCAGFPFFWFCYWTAGNCLKCRLS